MGAVLASFVRDWVSALVRQLSVSDYLAGSLAMSFIAIARDAVANLVGRIVAWVKRRIWINVHLYEKETEFMMAWLRETQEIQSAPSLALYSRGSTGLGNKRIFEYEPEMRSCMRFRVATKDGSRQWMWITQKDRIDALEHESKRDRRLRGVTVSFLGRNKGVLEEILEKGRDIQRRKREKYLTVVQVYDYGKEHGLGWLHPQESDRKQPGRSIKSVVLPRVLGKDNVDQAEELLEDAKEFLASEAWYTERGIPYRRGYLLHGIPGGGKSSLIVAVASELRLPIYMLQLSSELMSDDTLNALLQHGMHDPPTILLLEDVDLLHSAALHRNSTDKDQAQAKEDLQNDVHQDRGRDQDTDGHRRKKGRLTLSGLLNALDGPTATTGRLLFMTTNAKHRLDPALLRSGRIDYEIEFCAAEQEQVQRLFTRFYSDFATPSGTSSALAELPVAKRSTSGDLPEEKAASLDGEKPSAELARTFAERVAASGVALTTADIQRHLMKHKKDPMRAINDLPALLQVAERSGVLSLAPGADTAREAEPVGPAEPAEPTKLASSTNGPLAEVADPEAAAPVFTGR